MYRYAVSFLALATLVCEPTVAAPSAGCGRPPPERPLAQVEVDGQDRKFISVIPQDYHADKPYRLVLAFHGRTNNNEQARSYYRLEPQDRTGTIFVYPSGIKGPRGRFSWWNQGDKPDALRDYALFDRLIELFAESYCLDQDKIFVVGHSLGATFANSLACARGDRIRAAATLGGGMMPSSPCRGELGIMLLHNPQGDLVPVALGLRARNVFLKQYALTGDGSPAEPRALNCERYGLPGQPAAVLWCPHGIDHNARGRYYPHTWPPQAGPAVMNFFAEFAPQPHRGRR